jgi:hypothetical protein
VGTVVGTGRLRDQTHHFEARGSTFSEKKVWIVDVLVTDKSIIPH